MRFPSWGVPCGGGILEISPGASAAEWAFQREFSQILNQHIATLSNRSQPGIGTFSAQRGLIETDTNGPTPA